MEQVPCPKCQGELAAYDRRKRPYLDENGDKHPLSVRRLRCQNQQCRRLHTELPDFLVPYKRYAATVFAAVLSGTAPVAPLEESTRWRWRNWYRRLLGYFLGVYASLRRQMQETARTLLASPKTPAVVPLLEANPGLSELVRLAVNSGNWVTTRSAVVTGPLAL